jgi:hypothetical protein
MFRSQVQLFERSVHVFSCPHSGVSPDTRERLAAARTDHARVRAWIRLAFNEQSLGVYVGMLMEDASLLRCVDRPYVQLL